jgi:hypothetical protein
MAAAPDWWAGAHASLVQEQRKSLTDELAPLKEKLDSCDKRLGSVESKQSSMDARLSKLESGTGADPAGFTPSFLSIKGWCEFDEKDTHGYTRENATELLVLLCSMLSPDLKQHVGNFSLTGARNYSIKVPINPEFLREIGNTWRDELRSRELKSNRGFPFKITAQMHPDIAKRYAATGKLLDFVRDICDGKGEPKAFFAPDFEVFLEVPEEPAKKAYLIGKASEDSKVTWDNIGLGFLGCRNEAEADVKLRGFRRK